MEKVGSSVVPLWPTGWQSGVSLPPRPVSSSSRFHLPSSKGWIILILQFGACGTVLQHVMPPNSNWMHIRFQTRWALSKQISTWLNLTFFRLQATKALGKNAGVLGGSIMVGVAPCRDESVLDALNTRSGAVSEKSIPYTCWRVLQWSFLLSMAVGTPTLDTSVANLSSNLGGTPRSIRPLTQAYRSDNYYINHKLSHQSEV